ncbi:hypothetical protein [Leptolyngbya sp. GGD]|uniref:hypothetical protein n=1 Tax=Leptolyngbya sp. GGD TaxID=2997907 RepID=UPI00227B68FC|nr:hypothetical protein [Leptolyngbya sp. GGD]MCY6489470.1 hypothetical protein [Leptolyngbya sp. GGD]
MAFLMAIAELANACDRRDSGVSGARSQFFRIRLKDLGLITLRRKNSPVLFDR